MPRAHEPDQLDPQQFEAVMRRASELQEQSNRALDRADVVRIARELGIEARHVERAIDEVRARRPGRDPYQLAAWVVLGLGFIFVLVGIYRTLLWAL
jgi:hypothetical protein